MNLSEIYNEKLESLYKECICELKSIGIEILDTEKIGTIDIRIAQRNAKRYGCCKNEKPDTNCYTITRKGRYRVKKYEIFKEHHIEISKWVMELDDKIIKNTIMHEIIHCLPYCNNHGKEFKKYANYINEKLEYDISRVGNKKEDYKQSNLDYQDESKKYKYKILCKKCGAIIYRQRFNTRMINRYRCGKCNGKLEIL